MSQSVHPASLTASETLFGIAFLVLAVWAAWMVLRLLGKMTAPVIQDFINDLKHPSHLLYLGLFLFGTLGSANVVFDGIVSGAVPKLLDTQVLCYVLLAFFSTNVLHQYLIYRACISSEDTQSQASLDYGPWWIGTKPERALRVLILVVLVAISHELWRDGKLLFIALANGILFVAYLTWNLLALLKLPAAAPVTSPTLARHLWSSEQKELDAALKRKNLLEQAAALDAIAAVMWFGISTPYAIPVVTVSAFGYAVYFLKVRIFGEGVWHRAYFVLIVLTVLVHKHWLLFLPCDPLSPGCLQTLRF